MELRPIGVIETPWQTVAACPRNGHQPKPAPVCKVHVLPDFVPGLLAVEGFSHLVLLYWLNQSKQPLLRFTPPFDGQERGLFATRSPARPNPIGLSVVAFDGFAAPDCLLVRYLDCVDGTPLLDIKPYLRTTDAVPEASMAWLERHATPPTQ